MKTIISIEWGGRLVSRDPRRRGLWVSRSRIETLDTVTEQRHLFAGQRWLVTWRWTRDHIANAPVSGGIPSGSEVR